MVYGDRQPSRTVVTKTFHVMQASLQFTDDISKMVDDLQYVISQEPDIVGFTEVNDDARRRRFQEVMRNNGYEPAVVGKSTTVLAAKLGGEGDLKVKSKGAVKAIPALAGAYQDRYIAWQQVRWFGQNIYGHEGHWSLLKWGEGRHTTVTNTMATQVKKHGQGNAISFFMGDLNIDEGYDNKTSARNMPNFVFRQNGLLTIYDELLSTPQSTIGEGSVFDVVGSYRPDKQVKGKRYKVHPKKRSDHSFVSAFYDIDVSVKTSTTTVIGYIPPEEPIDPTDPTVDPTELDPDFYVTGGNISWDDYLNDDLYPLPFAYGDSDSRTYG